MSAEIRSLTVRYTGIEAEHALLDLGRDCIPDVPAVLGDGAFDVTSHRRSKDGSVTVTFSAAKGGGE